MASKEKELEKDKILHGKKILERDFLFFEKLELYKDIFDNLVYKDILQFREYRFNTCLNDARCEGFILAWKQLNGFRDLTHRERHKKRDELLDGLRKK